jgi:2-methylaconitate cis-trans-isomerase PrpF
MKAGRSRDIMLFDGNLDAEMRNGGAVNDTSCAERGAEMVHSTARVSHAEMVEAAHYSACLKIHPKQSACEYTAAKYIRIGRDVMQQLTAAPTNRKCLGAVGCFSPNIPVT